MHVTDVISPNDPRADDPKMMTAKRKEVQGLLERGTFNVLLRSNIPRGANKLSGKYVLTIKDSGTDMEIWRARHAFQVLSLGV